MCVCACGEKGREGEIKEGEGGREGGREGERERGGERGREEVWGERGCEGKTAGRERAEGKSRT